MKTNRLFALGLMMALANGACGGDDSGGGVKPTGDSGTPGLPDSGPVTGPDSGPVNPGGDGGVVDPDSGMVITPRGATSKTITAAGGSITSGDGNLTVTFGRYAYRRPTKVEIAVASAPPAGAQGKVYELKPTTEPFSDQNNPLVTVTLKYTAADLGGGSPQDLKVGQYESGKWVELKPAPDQGGAFATKANPTTMTITAQIHSLAPVALLGGVCVECATTTCTAAGTTCSYLGLNGTDAPQDGKCVAAPAGGSCFVCRPTADDDNDGFATNGDCAPNDPKINPSAVELCNGIDDNCNNHTDEGCSPCKADADCKFSGEWCRSGFCDVQDCNTCTPSTCFQGTPQVPGLCVTYGVNNTCARCVETCDLDGDGRCPAPADRNAQKDCKEGDRTVYEGAPEICGNNVDDNCDNHIDENCNTCTTDGDCPVDGLVCVGGACQACPGACDPAACSYNGVPGTCEPYGKGCTRCIKPCDTDKDGNCGAEGQDCQEGNSPAVNAGALEICGNNIDDNCDQHIDEGCNPCQTYTECTGFQEYCNAFGACDRCPEITCDQATCVWPLSQSATTPTIPGKCGTYGKGCTRCGPPEGSDVDGDGYPSPEAVAAAKARTPSVDLLAGSVRTADCNDTVATSNPGAPEVCGNMVDDDCNGKPDDLCTTCETSMICGTASICDNSR